MLIGRSALSADFLVDVSKRYLVSQRETPRRNRRTKATHKTASREPAR
jgi:hypothetical protein